MLAVMIVQFFRTITSQDITIHSYSMLMFLSVLVYIYARERIAAIEAFASAGRKAEDELAPAIEPGTLRHKPILQPRRRGNPG
jgi:hypothetical protein